MNDVKLSRRGFLKAGTSTAAGAGLMLSGLAPSFAAPSSPQVDIGIKRQKKAMVFIMLDGGNDSFNMLVPTSDKHYEQYAKSRSNLALNKSELLPLNADFDAHGRSFGLHPSMAEVQTLFNNNKLAFIANLGPMIKPVHRLQFFTGDAPLPLGLLSHADQFKHWQTARPELRTNRGWFGYIGDALQPNKPEAQVPLNISLAGNNIMQNGFSASPYAINQQGSVGLVVNETKNALNNELLNSFETLLNTDYRHDPFKHTYLTETREAQKLHSRFRQGVKDIKSTTQFSDTQLSQELRVIARSIKAADDLNLDQQTFFVRYIGWDHHDELLQNHKSMLAILSQGLDQFQQALEELDIADKVVTFTGSDFGRTLTSNGNGTDHGWGGNTLVMGEPVAGGKIFGQYPELNVGGDNPLDIGNGVLIPTTPLDLLYAELALWFGVENKHILRLFPNLNNFKNNNLLPRPLGVLTSTGDIIIRVHWNFSLRG